MVTTMVSDNRRDPDQRRIVVYSLTRPVLQSGEGADRINGFLEDFVSAYRGWIETELLRELAAKYEACDRGARIRLFPADVRLHCLCREFGEFFSAHFTAEFTFGDEHIARPASFVWNSSDGRLLRLSELTGKPFAAARRGWRFYLASDGLRIYRTDRDGKIVKREKFPWEKLSGRQDPDIKAARPS